VANILRAYGYSADATEDTVADLLDASPDASTLPDPRGRWTLTTTACGRDLSVALTLAERGGVALVGAEGWLSFGGAELAPGAARVVAKTTDAIVWDVTLTVDASGAVSAAGWVDVPDGGCEAHVEPAATWEAQP
jgi:hypothetical protein